MAGYRGSGYVTKFIAKTDWVRWTFPAINGLYNLNLRYRTPGGPKGFDAIVNGSGVSGMFPATTAFALHAAGLVELTNGSNALQIGSGWNYYEIERADQSYQHRRR